MMKILMDCDITLANVDAIVNASNGKGYMGGKKAAEQHMPGVAESLQYATGGRLEKLAKAKSKEKGLLGFAPGSIFVTDAPGLNADCVIHAVTMRFPGSSASLHTIEKLAKKLTEYGEINKLETVAVPLLGCGTGGLDPCKVLKIFGRYFTDGKTQFIVYYNTCKAKGNLVGG